ncbi:MAG: hypothetical protein Q7S64_03280 [bacterium]|nr:hypothetical protein [bacterium]
MKNTKERGILRYLIYKDTRADEYVGVCVDIGLIKVGTNNANVKRDLINASKGFVRTVCEQNLSNGLLNQQPPQQYMDIFNEIVESYKLKRINQATKDIINEADTFSRTLPSLCLAT